MCKLRTAIVFGAILIGGVHGQSRGGGCGGLPQPPRTAKAAALYDITGYWVRLPADSSSLA
jgi:hypothetical protein